MTCVIVQFEQRRAEILVDTLAGNHTRPIAWANKAVVFQAQHMALIIRGPNQCRRHAYDELDQTYLRRGIDGAFEPLAELLAQRQDDMFTTYLGAPENFLDCHAYIVGWSPSAKSFTAWRLLSSPTFDPSSTVATGETV